jgi:RNA polymerase sigma-70 factor (ECF subfamily)
MWNSQTGRGSSCGLSFDELRVLPDEELFSHLEHHDGDALAVLYQRFRRLVYGVSLRILRDQGEAEDIVQQVFVDIYNTTLRYDPNRGTVRVWILQFAYHRSLRRKRQLQIRHFYNHIELSDAGESLIVQTNVLAGVENRQLATAALQALNGSQKVVIELACYEGHSLREISEITGETLANIRHYYYRGLKKLRQHLTLERSQREKRGREAADDGS